MQDSDFPSDLKAYTMEQLESELHLCRLAHNMYHSYGGTNATPAWTHVITQLETEILERTLLGAKCAGSEVLNNSGT